MEMIARQKYFPVNNVCAQRTVLDFIDYVNSRQKRNVFVQIGPQIHQLNAV